MLTEADITFPSKQMCRCGLVVRKCYFLGDRVGRKCVCEGFYSSTQWKVGCIRWPLWKIMNEWMNWKYLVNKISETLNLECLCLSRFHLPSHNFSWKIAQKTPIIIKSQTYSAWNSKWQRKSANFLNYRSMTSTSVFYLTNSSLKWLMIHFQLTDWLINWLIVSALECLGGDNYLNFL